MIENAGPAGWFDWLLNFRNMLVHRGRRLEIGQFLPREPVLLDGRGQPVLRARVVTHRMLAAALYDHQRDQWRNFD